MCFSQPDIPETKIPVVSPLPPVSIGDEAPALENPVTKRSFRRASQGVSQLRIPLQSGGNASSTV